MPSGGETLQYCSSLASWSCQNPRQGLQICQGHAIAHGSILIGGVGLRKGGLRVHDFQYGGFAAPVAKRRKTQALARQFGRAAEAAELVQSGFRFGVERFYFREELALREGEFPLRQC